MCSVIHKHRILYTKEFKSFIVVQSTIKIVHLGVFLSSFIVHPLHEFCTFLEAELFLFRDFYDFLPGDNC